MKIGRKERDLKLNWGISFGPNWQNNNPLAKTFSVWFFKLRELPPVGCRIDAMNYWGFFYVKDLFTKWNILVYTKQINLIYKIKITKK